MARRKLKDRDVRKLYKNSGGTTIVSLPKELVTSLKWQHKQKVTIRQSGDKLIIEDWKP